MIKGWNPHLQARLLSTDIGSCFDNQLTNDQGLMTSLSLMMSFSAILSLADWAGHHCLILAPHSISPSIRWSEFSCLSTEYKFWQEWPKQGDLQRKSELYPVQNWTFRFKIIGAEYCCHLYIKVLYPLCVCFRGGFLILYFPCNSC